MRDRQLRQVHRGTAQGTLHRTFAHVRDRSAFFRNSLDSVHNNSRHRSHTLSSTLQQHTQAPTVNGMSATSTPSQTGPPGADPSSSGQTTPAKRKFNWKNGPPSCKECVRLKLKVRLTATAFGEKLTSEVLAVLAVLQLRSARMRKDLPRRNFGWEVRFKVPDALPHFLHSHTDRPRTRQRSPGCRRRLTSSSLDWSWLPSTRRRSRWASRTHPWTQQPA